MAKIKEFFRVLLIKYWYLFLLFISLAFAFLHFIANKKIEEFFICRSHGSTLLLSNASLNAYMSPLSQWVKEKDFDNAERVLNVKKEILQKINYILFDAQTIVEEQDIRYDYSFVVAANDTGGFYLLEDALLKHLEKHLLLQEKYSNKKTHFDKNKSLVLADLKRVDSIISGLNDQRTLYYETLMQRRVDLKLQLSKIEEKFEEYYVLKHIFGFQDSISKIDNTTEFDKIGYAKWILIFIIADILLVFAIDRQFRNLFFS